MSLPRYAEYKDSGVGWLGQVPRHWRLARLKDVADVVNGFPFDSKLFDASGAHALVRIRDLNARETATRYSGEFVPAAAVTPSDVLVGMDGDFNVGRWLGAEVALLNQRMCCVRAKSSALATFLRHALPTPLKAINDITYSTTVKHLSSLDVEKIRFALPFGDELTSIAAFLDRETAEIDALIAEQEKLIALLAEKRQASISRAVRRGLNPDAPTKGSGVAWLGPIPTHWKVVPLRWYSQCKSGDGISSTDIEPFPDLEHGTPAIGGNGRMGFTAAGNVNRPVLAIGRVGALCGNVHVVHPPAWISDNALMLTPADAFCLEFLAHTLRSRNLNEIAAKTAQPLITGTQVADQRVPLPPMAEQKSIAEFISYEVGKLDSLKTEAERAIALLKERRSALTTAAVTGQIDVRAAA